MWEFFCFLKFQQISTTVDFSLKIFCNFHHFLVAYIEGKKCDFYE